MLITTGDFLISVGIMRCDMVGCLAQIGFVNLVVACSHKTVKTDKYHTYVDVEAY